MSTTVPPGVPIEELRSWVAARVRDGVVGSPDHAAARHAALFDAPGERWFGPDAAIRRVQIGRAHV